MSLGDAEFDNILAVWTFPNKTTTSIGTVVPSQRLDFRLTTCGLDGAAGALRGRIGSNEMTVVLDSGYIDLWTEGGRVHVASVKNAQLSSPGTNWLTQFNPALRELNDELGEIACCLH
jgi:hypothetical protein